MALFAVAPPQSLILCVHPVLRVVLHPGDVKDFTTLLLQQDFGCWSNLMRSVGFPPITILLAECIIKA